MPWRHVDLAVGLTLLLGPLTYALTLRPAGGPSAPAAAESCQPEGGEVASTAPAPADAPAIESDPLSSPPRFDPPSDDRLRFAFVNSAGILLHTEADTAWGTGPLRAHPGPGEYRASKRADPTQLPASVLAQQGRSLDLFGPSGKLCTVQPGALSILVQHDGPLLADVFVDEDTEVDYDAFDDASVSASQIRARVWRSDAKASAWLVAAVPKDPACEGALWARDSELPAPKLLHPSDEPSPLTRARIARFEASPEYLKMGEDYRAWYGDLDAEERMSRDDWATHLRDHGPRVRTWYEDAGLAQLVELTFGAASEGCGIGFDSAISSMEEVVDGRLVARDKRVPPMAVFDADFDGRYEFLYGTEDGSHAHSLESETPGLSADWSLFEVWYCGC